MPIVNNTVSYTYKFVGRVDLMLTVPNTMKQTIRLKVFKYSVREKNRFYEVE